MQKAKSFCYVSLGILALALAFHLGARSARASYVPPGESGIVGHQGGGNEVWVLLDNGQVWEYRAGMGWVRPDGPDLDPPVPVSDIKFWTGDYGSIVTRSNEVFRYNASAGKYGAWESIGPPPGLMATEASTWGAVKARFSRD